MGHRRRRNSSNAESGDAGALYDSAAFDTARASRLEATGERMKYEGASAGARLYKPGNERAINLLPRSKAESSQWLSLINNGRATTEATSEAEEGSMVITVRPSGSGNESSLVNRASKRENRDRNIPQVR